MEVERHAQRLRARQHRGEAGIVEEEPIRRAIHQRAVGAELRHAAFHLIGRRIGCAQRQLREAAEARGLSSHARRQRFIVVARECDALRALYQVRPGPRQREDLNGDPAGIHIRDAVRTKVDQLCA
ncbi:MAG: hypothetical protein V4653_10860 [Pseudomonadota bacterium]